MCWNKTSQVLKPVRSGKQIKPKVKSIERTMADECIRDCSGILYAKFLKTKTIFEARSVLIIEILKQVQDCFAERYSGKPDPKGNAQIKVSSILVCSWQFPARFWKPCR
tara:strand:+ start:1854 stop:2180 length:327 start_codon:yes stop_codon:yes gene_type:complete